MMKLKLSTLLLPLCLTLPLAFALEPDPLAVTHDFTQAEGYVILDEVELEEVVQSGLPGTVHIGELSALQVPVRAVEALDGVAERVRYHLSVSVRLVPVPPAADPAPVLLVQLDRYNLGPLGNKELVDAHGAENVAPLEEWDQVPHVSYRFVLNQLMAREANMLAASRREIGADEAAGRDCLGVPCLQTWSGVPEIADWSELEPLGESLNVAALEPTAILDQLAAAAFFEPFSHEAAFDALDEPVTIASMIVETNLGQERLTEGALRVGELRDDSLAAVWQRLVAFDTGAARLAFDTYSAQAFECRRGLSEDGYCL